MQTIQKSGVNSIQDLASKLEEQISRLSIVEQDIGYTEEIRQQRKIKLLQSVVDFVETHIDNINAEKQDIIVRTEQAQVSITSFKRLMGEYASTNVVLDPSKSLKENLHDITIEKKAVEKRYNERLVLVQDLYSQLEDFNEAMTDFVNTDMLKKIDVDVSSLAVNALEEEIQRCEDEYIRRKEEVDEGVKETLSLLVTLGYEAESDRDRIIENYYRETDPNQKMHLCNMLVSLEFMSYINNRINELKDQKRQVEHRKEEMTNSLKQLWHRLHIDAHECEVFLMANRGLTSKELQKFEDELEKLTKLKKERIGEFIETTREELKALWDQLYYSDKQREQFKPAFSTELTDSTLEAHETEISRLQLELEDSKYILEYIEKHMKLKNEIKEFNAMTSDPNRLFSKGQRDPGRLLREEKFRKRIERELPKVRKELEGSLLEYEALKGRPFLVYGTPYYDVLYEEQNSSQCKTPSRRDEGIAPKTPSRRDEVVAPKTPTRREELITPRTPKREPFARKPMTSPREPRARKLFFNTPQPTRVKSFHQLQPIQRKIDSSKSILHQVRAKNIQKRKQAKRMNMFDEESDDEDTTIRNENTDPIKHKIKKRQTTAKRVVDSQFESDDSIGLDLGIFDDGPDLSDMSEIDA